MTTPQRLRLCCALALALFGWAVPVQAQRNPSGLPSPRLYQISPAGAKAGATLEVVVAGRHLEEAEKLVFSHPGIKAEAVPVPKPEIDPKTKKPLPVAGSLPADLYRFKVTVAPDVPLGNHDVRLINKWGVSNPRVFVIGDLTEIAEKEPNSDVDQAQKVQLNTTINGEMQSPTDVDYFLVPVKKGQRVVVACLASSIDSRFQPQVEVFDSKDRQLASNRIYQGYDAVTDFTAPEDGDYLVRLYQFTHTFRTAIVGGIPAGSSDNFYRLSITTAPWIDAIVPSVVEPGKTTTVTLYGRNLPNGTLDPASRTEDSILEKATLTVTAPADGRGKLRFSGHVSPSTGWQDGIEVRVKNAAGASNPFLLGLADAPLIQEAANNDTPETAQEVPLPCEIAGRIEKRRDRDWYLITAKKGETWNIEVTSSRLGAPTYMTILVRNQKTKAEIYESPLNENTNLLSPKFFSRSEDPPVYRFTAAEDGKYELLVASRAGDTIFGPRHSYSVRIQKDVPDFQLVALGSSDESPDVPSVGQGGHEALTVVANRSDTFSGDIELAVEGLPAGVICPPQVLNGSVRQASLVLTAAPSATPWVGQIKVKGTATINGVKVVREARTAGIIWPVQPNQNTPTITRLEHELWLSVRGKAPFTLSPTIDRAEIVQGDKATVTIAINRMLPDIKNPVQVSLMAPQNRPGLELANNLRFNNNQPVNINANQNGVPVPVTVANDVPPGTYNIVFRGQTQIPFNKNPMDKNRPNTFIVQASAPISVTVLPKSLAQVSLSTTNPTVKIGGQTELMVRVVRLFNYQGEFKVQVVLPAGIAGVEAAEVTIPANQNEAKLVLKAPAGAAPGGRSNLVVKATALFNGKTPTVHETKFNLNVTK
ncbi:MAG: PPC domain-containing protein [Gemmataceae bacterium]